jgi:hypothetical protein
LGVAKFRSGQHEPVGSQTVGLSSDE